MIAIAENGKIMGSITGVPAANVADKLWLAFQALGDIAFAYPYSIIVIEIQVYGLQSLAKPIYIFKKKKLMK